MGEGLGAGGHATRR